MFGNLVTRTVQTGSEAGAIEETKLSAKTRPGLAVDIEHDFAPRFAIRIEGTFTHAPLAIKATGETGGAPVGSGGLNVGTAMVPVVVRINPNGAFRFHVMGGPAYAVYHITRNADENTALPPFTGTRGRWGGAFGGGVAWSWTRTFAVEGQITDIDTASPFERRDFPETPFSKVKIPRTRNVHTTVGIRYRF